MKAVGQLRRRRLDDELKAARVALPPRPHADREALIVGMPAHALGVAIKQRKVTSLEAVTVYCHRTLYVMESMAALIGRFYLLKFTESIRHSRCAQGHRGEVQRCYVHLLRRSYCSSKGC